MDLPPLPGYRSDLLPEPLLFALLDLSPPHVVRLKSGLFFLSGLRLLTLAQQLTADLQIPVALHHGRLDIHAMQLRALTEHLMSPLLYVLGKEMVEPFLRAASNLGGQSEYESLAEALHLNDKSRMAELLGVSIKTITRHEP